VVKRRNGSPENRVVIIPTSPTLVAPRCQTPPYWPISSTTSSTRGSLGKRSSTGGSDPAATISASAGASAYREGGAAGAEVAAGAGAVVGCAAGAAVGPAGAVGWPHAAATVAAAVRPDMRMKSRRVRACMALLSPLFLGSNPTVHRTAQSVHWQATSSTAQTRGIPLHVQCTPRGRSRKRLRCDHWERPAREERKAEDWQMLGTTGGSWGAMRQPRN